MGNWGQYYAGCCGQYYRPGRRSRPGPGGRTSVADAPADPRSDGTARVVVALLYHPSTCVLIKRCPIYIDMLKVALAGTWLVFCLSGDKRDAWAAWSHYTTQAPVCQKVSYMNMLKVALWLAHGLFFARVETRGMGLGYWYMVH